MRSTFGAFLIAGVATLLSVSGCGREEVPLHEGSPENPPMTADDSVRYSIIKLSNEEPPKRVQAAETLAHRAGQGVTIPPEGIAKLEELAASDPDESVKKAAQAALDKIKAGGGGGAEAPAATE